MKSIVLIKDFGLEPKGDPNKDREAEEIFNGPFRRLLKVRLKNGAVLSRHKATEPITVYCLSGTGVFRAGQDLEDSQDLHAGVLITLESGVEHEVVAIPSLHLIVTKFKDS